MNVLFFVLLCGSAFAEDRIVVTGMGMVSPIGNSVDESFEALLQGKSGIGPITLYEVPKFFPQKVAAEVKGFEFDPKQYQMKSSETNALGRYQAMGIEAMRQAIGQAHLTGFDPERVGIYTGVGLGELAVLENASVHIDRSLAIDKNPLLGPGVYPLALLQTIPNMLAGRGAMTFGFKGPNQNVCTACASGLHAFIEAVDQIKLGKADAMVVGGAESVIALLGNGAFEKMRALSPSGVANPFDQSRDGFVIGEGAAFFVVEKESSAKVRNAKVLAYVGGGGTTADAQGLTKPDPDGSARAIRLALNEAGIEPERLDLFHAHATGTPVGDDAELVGIQKVMGDHAKKIAIFSTKWSTGHPIGAAGPFGIAFTIKAMQEGKAPGMPLLKNPSMSDFNLLRQTTCLNVSAGIVQALGFGGQNAVVILFAP